MFASNFAAIQDRNTLKTDVLATGRVLGIGGYSSFNLNMLWAKALEKSIQIEWIYYG